MTTLCRLFVTPLLGFSLCVGHSECFVGTVVCLIDQNKTWAVNAMNKKLISHFSKISRQILRDTNFYTVLYGTVITMQVL
jgi:hypothetical protein